MHKAQKDPIRLLIKVLNQMINKENINLETGGKYPFERIEKYLTESDKIFQVKVSADKALLNKIRFFQPASIRTLISFLQAYPVGLYHGLIKAVHTIRTRTVVSMRQNSEILQNDFIQLMHKNIKEFGKVMGDQLTHIIIDEFQDTDLPQWEIFFNNAKNNKIPLWVVGDPKQAIYSFRGGDIQTYFKARDALLKISQDTTRLNS